MIEALFNQPNHVAAKKTADAVALRQEAISHNLTSLETPDYKRVDLAPNFDQELERATASNDFNAQQIREIAEKHQVPIMQNIPLARMLFKHGKVGGEIPAQLYAAVAEVLAWVYRINRYRYFSERNNA